MLKSALKIEIFIIYLQLFIHLFKYLLTFKCYIFYRYIYIFFFFFVENKTRCWTSKSTSEKTVKERLAKKLGIMCNNRRGSCSFTGSSQNESQTLSQPQSSHSSFSQAIPTLDLFGSHNRLDDFSGYVVIVLCS